MMNEIFQRCLRRQEMLQLMQNMLLIEMGILHGETFSRYKLVLDPFSIPNGQIVH